jgi:hypothetical protein
VKIRVLTLSIAAFGACAVGVSAQWVRTPANSIPRTKDGKANLSAPAPRAADGKPDLSGVWQAASSPIPELIGALSGLNGGEGGLGEDTPVKYFINVLADFKHGEAPLRPEAAAADAKLSLDSASKDAGGLNCLPDGVPLTDTLPSPFKLVQSARLTVMLIESDVTFRQIFTDGRRLPDDPQPSWLGYSVGRWEGDTFIVETNGFNDRSQLDALGHRHSAALRVTERFRRRNVGPLDIAITLDDPQTFTRPITINVPARLLPDGDLIEYYCKENEKDVKHVTTR